MHLHESSYLKLVAGFLVSGLSASYIFHAISAEATDMFCASEEERARWRLAHGP